MRSFNQQPTPVSPEIDIDGTEAIKNGDIFHENLQKILDRLCQLSADGCGADYKVYVSPLNYVVVIPGQGGIGYRNANIATDRQGTNMQTYEQFELHSASAEVEEGPIGSILMMVAEGPKSNEGNYKIYDFNPLAGHDYRVLTYGKELERLSDEFTPEQTVDSGFKLTKLN